MPSGKRLRAATGAVLLFAFGALAPASRAQVPPLPPEVRPALEVVSPVVAPACGNAILGATIVGGTAPPEAREAIELATANIFVLCGSVPIPPSAPTHCVDEEVMATVLAQLGGLTIGGALPVAPPSAGQVVDAIRIVQERFPVPADDESLVASAAAALECRFASVSAPTPGRTPSAPEDTTDGPPVITDGGPGLVPIGTGPPIPVGVLPPLAGVPSLAAPTVPTGASAPEAPRPVGYPILLAPVIIGALAILVGRGLVARPSD